MFIEVTKVERYNREDPRHSKIMINTNQIVEIGNLDMGSAPPLCFIRHHGGMIVEIKETYEEVKKLIMGER